MLLYRNFNMINLINRITYQLFYVFLEQYKWYFMHSFHDVEANMAMNETSSVYVIPQFNVWYAIEFKIKSYQKKWSVIKQMINKKICTGYFVKFSIEILIFLPCMENMWWYSSNMIIINKEIFEWIHIHKVFELQNET